MISLLSSLFILLLTGIIFLGKGFCYLGVYPLFVTEFVLLVSVIALPIILYQNGGLVFCRSIWHPMNLILVNIAFQVFILFYHMDSISVGAFRDFSIWIYAIFAGLTYALHTRNSHGHFLLEIIKKRYVYYLLLLPGFFYLVKIKLITWHLNSQAPVPIVFLKSGDVAVVLGVLLSMVGFRLIKTNLIVLVLTFLNIFLWTVTARAGMLCVLFTLLFVFISEYRSSRYYRVVAIGLGFICVFMVLDFEIEIPMSRGHSLSSSQFMKSATSIFLESGESLESTKKWRLSIWSKVVDYTFGGDYFFTGKGYGVNLADVDGYQLKNKRLRSPHNIFITILSRSGVPGLTLWVVFLIRCVVCAVQYIRECNVYADQMKCLLLAFLLMLLNGSFDVYLEGPMGGVLFWTTVGSILYLINYKGHHYRLQGRQGTSSGNDYGPNVVAGDC